MNEQQKRYFKSVRIDEVKRLIDTILGYKKPTDQDKAVLADARKIYRERMSEDYR